MQFIKNIAEYYQFKKEDSFLIAKTIEYIMKETTNRVDKENVKSAE